MYIGRLNQKFENITYQVYKKDTMETPIIRENGNPFVGEQFRVHWEQIIESGVDLYVHVEGKFYVNEVVLSFAKKSTPNYVKLYSANKENELYCYRAETGKTISQKVVALPIEAMINEFVIEIGVGISDITFEDISIYGADLQGEKIFPTPVKYEKIAGDEIPISKFTTYSYHCEEGKIAAQSLIEKYMETTGILLTEKVDGDIQFRLNSDIKENGYALTVRREGVTIEASDLRGMVYGAETFMKMIAGGCLQPCEVEDYPRMPFRGVHLMIPHPSQFDFAKRLVKYVISPMGYNCIIMELAGAMEYESHPEINRAVEEAWIKGAAGEWPLFPHKESGCGATVKKEVLRDFVAYSRSFGIDVIPEIQSLGHVQFMTIAHPEITERPEKTQQEEVIDGKDADIPPNEFYGHSYCPSNPKTYEILFDLIDEIVDVFSPKEYVHMGHDEVYQIGVCPLCKDKNPAEILAYDINKIHAYLADKGLKMMVWADMFQPVTKYKTSDAIKKIPKDVLLMDFVWYFHMDKDIEDNLLKEGFKVVMGNMYSSHYPRYESRVVKDGIVGAQTSTWVATSEKDIAREGKMYELLYAAQMLWSSEYTGHTRYSYDKLIGAMMPKIREHMKGIIYPSLTCGKNEITFVDNGEYHSEAATYGGRYAIGQMAESLIFEHVTSEKRIRIPWEKLEEIGTYGVEYEDGSVERIPVTYAGNISCHNRRHSEPFQYGYYRHNGYSAVSYETDGIETRDKQGNYTTIYRFEWVNPKPDLKIYTIEYRKDPTCKTEVYVQRILGVQ